MKRKNSTIVGGSLLLLGAALTLSGCNFELSEIVGSQVISKNSEQVSSATSAESEAGAPIRTTVSTGSTSIDSGNTSVDPTKEFVVTFVNYNGKQLARVSVPAGGSAKYNGFEPVRNAEKNYKNEFIAYEFAGWDKSLDNVNQDLTVTAQFKEKVFASGTFGNYPTNVVTDSTLISRLNSKSKDSLGRVSLDGKNYVYLSGSAYTSSRGRITAGGHYYEVTPILWSLVKSEGNRVTVIATDAITALPFNTVDGSYNYENSSIRSWLNNDFITMAFKGDKSRIASKVIDNSLEQHVVIQDHNECDDTYDKVSLMSRKEFAEFKMKDLEEGRSLLTDFALANGAYALEDDGLYLSGDTLLRTPCSEDTRAGVYHEYENYFTDSTMTRKASIRPVLTLTLTDFTYGEYPQSVVDDEDLKAELEKIDDEDVDELGYKHYQGKKYLKAENMAEYISNMDYAAEEGEMDYYEVEPIKWKPISDNNGNYVTLICERTLDTIPTDADYEYEKHEYGSDFDYKYSIGRQWLTNDFYNRAFAYQNSHLVNNKWTVDPDDEWSLGRRDSTSVVYDKVALPTAAELMAVKAGWNINKMETDYSKAQGDTLYSDVLLRNGAELHDQDGEYVEDSSVIMTSEGYTLPGDDAFVGLAFNPVIKLAFFEAEVTYGEYAQSVVEDSELYSVLSGLKRDIHNVVTYNGERYKRCVTKLGENSTDDFYSSDAYNMDDDMEETRCFHWDNWIEFYKIEPVKWRVLENDGEHVKVISERVIESCEFNDKVYQEGSQNVYNDYKYSKIRQFITGQMYENLFASGDERVLSQYIDNSYHTSGYKQDAYDYGAMVDKITLLSAKEIQSRNYFNDEFDAHSLATDYIKATGFVDYIEVEDANDEGWFGEARYHNAGYVSRSPREGTIYSGYGRSDYGYECEIELSDKQGIRPVVLLSI